MLVGLDAAQRGQRSASRVARAVDVPVKPNPVGRKTPLSDSIISHVIGEFARVPLAIGDARRERRSLRS